jgi:uncharacterized protein YqfA (UPF0365 family)
MNEVLALFLPMVLIFFAILILWLIPVRLWIEALSAGVRVGIGTLVGMRLRKVSPPAVVRPLINATKAGLDLDINLLEAHYLAGGRVDRVVGALISADKASIDLAFNQAAAIDLAETSSRQCRSPSTRRSSTRPRSPPWRRTASSSSRSRA